MRKSLSIKARGMAVLLTAVLCVLSIVSTLFFTAKAEEGTKSEEYTSSKVLKFSVDLGEDFASAAAKNATVSFAKLQGEFDNILFAAGDKVVYDVYNPDMDGGGFTGNAFTPLADAPWATDWEFFHGAAANWVEQDPSWGVAGANAEWKSVTRTLKDEASLVGKRTDFWALTFGVGAATKRTADFYYKNFRLVGADDVTKLDIFSNFAQFRFTNTMYNICSAGVAATVTIVDDPLLALEEKEGSSQRAIAYSLDMGEDFATAKERNSTIIFNSPTDKYPNLAAGDTIEYDVYSATMGAADVSLAGQLNDAFWTGVYNKEFKELNQKNVAMGWSTLDYNAANGTVFGADLSKNFYTRRLMIKYNDTSMVGNKLYHVAVISKTNKAFAERYQTVYFRNIRVRANDGAIKYNIFDGTQNAASYVSTKSNCEGIEVSAQINASVEIVDNPFADMKTVRADGTNDSRAHLVTTYTLKDTTAAAKKMEINLFGEDRQYAIKDGDKLVYSVSSDTNTSGVGALELIFTDNTKLSSTEIKDNANLPTKANADIGNYITKEKYTNPWMTRTIDLSSLKGKTIKNYVAALDTDKAQNTNIIKVKFSDIKIVNGENVTDIYNGAAKGFDKANATKISGTDNVGGMVLEEPIMFSETRLEYLSIKYDIDDKTLAENRHFNISLFGFCSLAYNLEKGDRLFYSMRVNEQVGVNAFMDIQTDFDWGGFTSLGVTDQRGLAANNSSLVENVWTGRYFEIDKPGLLNPVAHWYVSLNVNGAVEFDSITVDLADIYIQKPNGDKFDILNGTTAKVEKGSMSIFGQVAEYKKGITLKDAVSTGYTTDSSQKAPEEYIKLDYSLGGTATGNVQARTYNLSLFGADFSTYKFKAGDKLSYDINMSAALAGLGMLDVQVVDDSNETAAYHGKYIRDINAAKYGAKEIITDNYGLYYGSATDISRIAASRWATRVASIPTEFTGYRIQHMSLALSNESKLQSYVFTDVVGEMIREITVMIGNIKILHADGTETIIYGDSKQKFDAEKTQVLDEAGDITIKLSATVKEEEKPEPKPEPTPEKTGCNGCGGEVTAVSTLAVLLLMGASLVILFAKKTKRKDS